MSGGSLSREDLAALKQREPFFYFADLLLPEPLRQTAQVLHAFHAELNALAAKSTEPMVGQIRFQWWQEVIDGERDGEAQSHPLASQLSNLVRSGTLDGAMLSRKIEAHVFDLYHDPMPDTEAFEVWCGETRSVLFQQLLSTLRKVDGAAADACGHAGVALGYVDALSALPQHRATGRRFLPTDLPSQHGLSDADWTSAPTDKHVAVVRAAAEVGLSHLERALAAVGGFDGSTQALFPVLAPIRAVLKSYSRADVGCFTAPISIGQLRLQWLLFRGI